MKSNIDKMLKTLNERSFCHAEKGLQQGRTVAVRNTTLLDVAVKEHETSGSGITNFLRRIRKGSGSVTDVTKTNAVKLHKTCLSEELTNMSLTKNKLFGMALIAIMLFVGSVGITNAQAMFPAKAGSTIVNGTWDGSTEADAAGELTISLSGVITGMLADSLDTIDIDSGYSFSDLPAPINQSATSYDTVYFQYHIQNQGNLASDSFSVLANIVDTAAAGGFIATDFDICQQSDSTVISTGPVAGDSAEYFVRLASAAVDSFLIRVVIPSPDSAADQDSIHIAVTVKDADGDGSEDNWPGLVGTAIRRVVIDTAGVFYNTNTDTMWDFGDTQTDTVRIVVGGPTMRLKKIAALESGTSLPGDSIAYTIMYDNDGSAATEDTAFIVDYLPYGVALLETIQTNPGDNSAGILTYVYYKGATWLNHVPDGSNAASLESLIAVTAIKFAIAPGVGADAGDADQVVADDSTGNDAGVITYRVRIR